MAARKKKDMSLDTVYAETAKILAADFEKFKLYSIKGFSESGGRAEKDITSWEIIYYVGNNTFIKLNILNGVYSDYQEIGPPQEVIYQMMGASFPSHAWDLGKIMPEEVPYSIDDALTQLDGAGLEIEFVSVARVFPYFDVGNEPVYVFELKGYRYIKVGCVTGSVMSLSQNLKSWDDVVKEGVDIFNDADESNTLAVAKGYPQFGIGQSSKDIQQMQLIAINVKGIISYLNYYFYGFGRIETVAAPEPYKLGGLYGQYSYEYWQPYQRFDSVNIISIEKAVQLFAYAKTEGYIEVSLMQLKTSIYNEPLYVFETIKNNNKFIYVGALSCRVIGNNGHIYYDPAENEGVDMTDIIMSGIKMVNKVYPGARFRNAVGIPQNGEGEFAKDILGIEMFFWDPSNKTLKLMYYKEQFSDIMEEDSSDNRDLEIITSPEKMKLSRAMEILRANGYLQKYCKVELSFKRLAGNMQPCFTFSLRNNDGLLHVRVGVQNEEIIVDGILV